VKSSPVLPNDKQGRDTGDALDEPDDHLWLPSSNNNRIGRQEQLSDQLMDLLGGQQPIVDHTGTIIRRDT
jgi:hypothetical protein